MIKSLSHDTGATIVRPGTARLTAANARAFKDDVAQVIETGSTQLIIDLSGVIFVDSSGLGALVGLLKKIGYRGDLAMAGLNADVAKMFRICRMDKVFNIYPTVDQAAEKMADTL